MKRLMISAMASGSGKTVLTCALMRVLMRRGLSVESYKCGPDYIDPMFHSRVLGIPGRSLDLFLQGRDGVLRSLRRSKKDIAVLEGAMGFYDGLGMTGKASAWQMADVTKTPVFLVVKPSGQSLTLAAQIKGMQTFRSPGHIAGIILTDASPSFLQRLKPVLERETGLPVLGFLPHMEEAVFPSRHLGLIQAEEIRNFNERIDVLADALEKNTDLVQLLKLSLAGPLPAGGETDGEKEGMTGQVPRPYSCRIAVARDEAFSFYYQDNLDLLRLYGAEPVFFSPLHDRLLPDADGLYLGGGYPELYLRELSENTAMRDGIRRAVRDGMPVVAECGGFLYLQDHMRDENGKNWAMAGVFPGEGFRTERLQRFGYLTLHAEKDSLLFRAGEKIPAHEFHYWDTNVPGDGAAAVKEDGRSWRCAFLSDTVYAGFPHLNWGGEIPMAARFAGAAARYHEKAANQRGSGDK